MGFFDDYADTTSYKEIDLNDNPEGLTPEQARLNYAVSQETGTPLGGISQQMRDDYVKRRMFEGSGDSFKRAMANPTFRGAVKGSEADFFSVENAVNMLRPNDPQHATGWFDTLRSATARSVINLDQSDNASDAADYRLELDRLRKPGNEVEYAARGKDIEERIRELAQVIARNETARELLTPNDSPMQRLARAYEEGGFFGALGELASAPIDSATDLFAEASLPMAAVLGAGAAVGTVATAVGSIPASVVLALSALTVGMASYWQNSNSSVLERMRKVGVNTSNADEVADFLINDKRFHNVRDDAMLYAAPVAVTDALSFGLAKVAISTPLKLGERVYNAVPPMARAYEQFNANAYRHLFQNVATEMAMQGTLGAGGEALGQIAADGGITDPFSVWINGLTDIITSPMEIAGATLAVRSQVRAEAARVEHNAKALGEAVRIAQNSTAMKESPELLDVFAQSIAADNPNAEHIGIDVASIAHEGNGEAVLGKIRTVLPGLASDLDNAVTAGGTVEVSLADYFRITQDAELSATVLDHSIIDSSMSLAQASGAGGGNGNGGKPKPPAIGDHDLTINSLTKGMTPEFKASLIEVAQDYKKQLQQSPDLLTEKGNLNTEAKAALSLTMNHVATMARDAGMTPKEAWDAYGIRGVQRLADDAKPKGIDENGNVVEAAGYYTPPLRTIARAATANRATLLHETGHWYWFSRAELASALKAKDPASLTDAQRHFIDVTEKTVRWLGAKDLDEFMSMDIEKSRPMHEKFARTYEEYLKTGQAPTPALTRVFRMFSGWLKQIYGVIANVPYADKMTPDVRELFDTLFVSYEQVHEAQLRRNLFLTLRDATEGNAGDAEILAAINALFTDADSAAVEKMLDRGKRLVGYLRSLRDNKGNDLIAEAKALRKKYTEEAIAAAVGPERAKADAFFGSLIEYQTKSGNKGHFRPKLLDSDLRAMGLTADEVKVLTDRGFVTTKKGMATARGDLAPTLLGFPSKEAMARAMLFDPFHGLDPEDAVRPQVEQRIQAERPDIADPESIRDTADAAVFNPTAERIISLEIQFLSGARGKPVEMELYNQVAKASLMGITIGDLDPRKYRNNATRLAERAQKALSKDPMFAASLKRQQLVQMRMADYAQQAIDNALSFKSKMRKRYPASLRDGKSMPIEYLEQLQNLLADININQERPANDNIPSYADFCAANQGLGVPDMPTGFGSTPFETMTVGQALEAMSFVENFILAAKLRYKLIINGREMDARAFDQAEAQAIIANAAKKGVKGPHQNANEHLPLVTYIRDCLRSFGYAHMRFQTIWQILEGKMGGHFTETLGRMIDQSRDRSNEMQFTLGAEFAKKIEAFKKDLRNTTAERYDSLGGYFDKLQMLAIALNCGNEENFQRLLAGSDKYNDFRDADKVGTKWTKDDVLTAIGQAFTKEQIEKIQGIWDTVGSLGDELEAVEARTNNRRMKRVKAQKVFIPLPNGTVVELKGGYYPIKYDRRAATFDTKREASDMGGRTKVIRKVDSNNLKDRVGGGEKPIELTLAAGVEALNEAIHVICWRDTVMNLRKLLHSTSDTTHAIQGYFGKEVYEELRTWVNDIATNGSELKADPFTDFLRKNASIAGLGFNLVTAALQPIGNIQSLAVVGGTYCAGAMARYMARPLESRDFVMSNSKLMADRMRTRFKELREVQNFYTQGRRRNWKDAITAKAFLPIAFSQIYSVDIPTWMAGFERGMVEGQKKGLLGNELHDFAVSRADRLLVESQGGGDLADLSRIERTRSVWNVFYSFFGTVLNAEALIAKGEGGLLSKALRIALIAFVQPVTESFLRAGLDKGASDDDGDYLEAVGKRWPKDLGSFWFGQFIIVRELGEAFAAITGETARYQGATGTRAIGDAFNLVTQASQMELDRPLRKAAVNLILGDLCGMPSTAINRFLDSTEAMADGEFWDALLYTVTGDKRKNP